MSTGTFENCHVSAEFLQAGGRLAMVVTSSASSPSRMSLRRWVGLSFNNDKLRCDIDANET
jgi:hypothetical protein